MNIWVILFVLFVIIEVLTFNLVTIWFAISSLIVYFISIFTENFMLEILVFSILSLILFVIITKFTNLTKKSNNYEVGDIGKEVIIKEKISKEEYLVKFKGSIWTAISDIEYNVNDKVIIKKFMGNKIKI